MNPVSRFQYENLRQRKNVLAEYFGLGLLDVRATNRSVFDAANTYAHD
jgi:hypothetical protein